MVEDKSTIILDHENFDKKVHPDHYRVAQCDIVPSHFLFHILSRATKNASYITVAFDKEYLVDELKFIAYSHCWGEKGKIEEIKEPFSYKVETSKRNMDTWTTVVDHSVCKCYHTQQLFFPKQAAQYVS